MEAGQRDPVLPHAVGAGVDAAMARLDRRIARIISLAGCVLALAVIVPGPGNSALPAWWWLTGSVLLCLLLAVLAIAPRWLTVPATRSCWLMVTLLGAALQLGTTPARAGFMVDGDTLWSGTWLLTGIYLSLLMLRSPGPGAHRRALIGAVLLAPLPALSALLTNGVWAPWMLIATMQQFTNVAYCMILIPFRTQMRAHFTERERSRGLALELAAAESRVAAERDLDRLAHDRVLGVLNAAAMWEGPQPSELIAMARDSLATMDDAARRRNVSVAVRDFQEQISKTVRERDPACTLDVEATPGDVPGTVAAAFADAFHEALGNSVRHAPLAHRRVTALISADFLSVTIADTGPGFDLDRIPEDRLGVRESILGRLGAVRGASAQVTSHPGQGTRVGMIWRVENP